MDIISIIMETHHAVHSLARLCHVRAVFCIVSVWTKFNWPRLNSVCFTRSYIILVRFQTCWCHELCSEVTPLLIWSLVHHLSFYVGVPYWYFQTFFLFCSFVVQLNCTEWKELTWHGCNLWVLLWGHLYIDLSCCKCTDLIL